MNKKTAQTYQSILKGEAKFKLDEESKKVFSSLVKKAKKHKQDPSHYSQVILCGEEEFAQTKKQTPKTRKKK